MKRPFFRSSIDEIEQIVEERNVGDDLSDIIHELTFRKTKRAKKLFSNLKGLTKKSPSYGKPTSHENINKGQMETGHEDFEIKVEDDPEDVLIESLEEEKD